MVVEVELVSTSTLVKISYGIHNAPVCIANHFLSYLKVHSNYFFEEHQN
jgi:hypothetical protein